MFGKWKQVRVNEVFAYFQTMVSMNKIMDPRKTAETMHAFERENAKMEMTDEMSRLLQFI